MCNPAAIGLAVTVIGTGLQYKANQDRKEDMRRLQRRETERQDRLQKEAEGSLIKNQQSYERSNLEDAMRAAAGEREAQYAAAEAAAPRTFDAVPGQSVTSNAVVQDAFTRAFADAGADATARGKLGAELASFGDALGLKAIENNRRTGDIGMIGSFMQGSSSVLPLELQSAMTKTRGAEVLGALLSSAGASYAGGGYGTGGKLVKTSGGTPKTKTGGNTKNSVDFTGIFG